MPFCPPFLLPLPQKINNKGEGIIYTVLTVQEPGVAQWELQIKGKLLDEVSMNNTLAVVLFNIPL